MSEAHCETSVAIVKRNSTRASAKHNQVSPLEEPDQTHQHQITPSNFIIKMGRGQTKRKPLPLAIQMSANYSYGCSLQSLVIQNSSYEIVRMKRFPCSQFLITETSEKTRSLTLVSNFLGTKYNLFQQDEIILTIAFVAGLCANFGSRQFSIYSLGQSTNYADLKKESARQDLSQLWDLPQNLNKIKKFVALQPKRNLENGELSLNFARKCVVPAVQNAVLIDILGEQMMEIVKLGQNVHEVSFKENIPKVWGIALGVASLDFKWALQ